MPLEMQIITFGGGDRAAQLCFHDANASLDGIARLILDYGNNARAEECHAEVENNTTGGATYFGSRYADCSLLPFHGISLHFN